MTQAHRVARHRAAAASDVLKHMRCFRREAAQIFDYQRNVILQLLARQRSERLSLMEKAIALELPELERVVRVFFIFEENKKFENFELFFNFFFLIIVLLL